MKAMTSFTVKSLRDSAARTVVTIAGVALAAALLVAVLSSYVSATDYLLRNEATANGTWMSQVVLPDDEKTREEIASAEDATDVETLATLQDVGFAGAVERAAGDARHLPAYTDRIRFDRGALRRARG